VEWVVRSKVRVDLGPAFVVEKQIEAPSRAEAEVMIALGANFPVGFEILFPDGGAAGIALDPEALGANAPLVDGCGILDGLFIALKPGHG
jgi:hypothetical protein